MNNLLAKFEAWKRWEVDLVDGIMFSPQDVAGFDADLFIACAEQGTTHPNGTIWNDYYFDDNSEAVERFLEWLKEGK